MREAGEPLAKRIEKQNASVGSAGQTPGCSVATPRKRKVLRSLQPKLRLGDRKLCRWNFAIRRAWIEASMRRSTMR
jgi:hypothetical protein